MNNNTFIGIDAGGTKINIGRISAGRLLEEICIPTRADDSEEIILGDIFKGIEQIITPDVIGIGIGVPGLIDEDKGIVHNVANIPSWKEVHLKKRLELQFGKEVQVSNDANCFALGEKFFGKGEKFKNLVCLTLGTGVGAGIIINGDLYSGTLSISGEFGCIPYLQHTYEYYCSGKFFNYCYNISGNDLFEKAMLGDIKAIKIFDEYGGHLGNLLNIVLLTLGPEAIILGGSVAKSYRFFQKSMMDALLKFPFRNVVDQLFIEVSRNEKIAMLGAAALCFRKKEYSFDKS